MEERDKISNRSKHTNTHRRIQTDIGEKNILHGSFSFYYQERMGRDGENIKKSEV